MKEKNWFTIFIVIMAFYPVLSFPYNELIKRAEIVIPAWRNSEPKESFKNPSPETIIKTFTKKKGDFQQLFSFDSGATLQVGIHLLDSLMKAENHSFKSDLLVADFGQSRISLIVSKEIFKEG